MLVTRPLPASNCTPSVIFRAIELYRPTFLIDEADTFLAAHDEMRGVLNSGHRKSQASVIRNTGDDHTPTPFSTWCPKAVAAIGKLPDSLMDRSIVISMRRRAAGESVESLRFDRVSEELEPVRRKAARWAQDHKMTIALADPSVPGDLNDRATDNWRPLLALADAAGGNWPTLARHAAVVISGSAVADDESARVMLLEDIKAIFDGRAVDRIASADIVAELVEMEHRPWPEWRQGKPITVRQLARQLKPFEIAPKTIRTTTGTVKGYELDAFTDTFARYLPDSSVTASQTNKHRGKSDFRSVTGGANVTDENNDKPNEMNIVTDVTDGNGVSRGKGVNWEGEL